MGEFKYYVAFFSKHAKNRVTVIAATNSISTARNLQHIYNTTYDWGDVFVTEPEHIKADGYEVHFMGG